MAPTEIARAVRAGEQGSRDATDQFEADNDDQCDHSNEQQRDRQEGTEQATEERRTAARVGEAAIEAKPIRPGFRAGLLLGWRRRAVNGDDFDFERIAHGASVPRLRPVASGGCVGVWNAYPLISINIWALFGNFFRKNRSRSMASTGR